MKFEINGTELVKCDPQGATVVEIPQGITKIGIAAFKWCSSIKTIIIPEGVTLIPQRAFDCCDNLSEIILPQSLERIDSNAFNSCKSLQKIVIPDRVTSIGSGAFRQCGLTEVVLPEGIVSIGACAFQACRALESIYLPNSLQEIGDDAFILTPWEKKINKINETLIIGNCLVRYAGKEETYTVPDHITHIMYEAFSSTAVKKVIIPDSVKHIGKSAFIGCCQLTSITMPSHLEGSLCSTFYECNSLQSVVIPEGVTFILQSAFWRCYNLSEIILPQSLERIDSGAFKDCKSLQIIVIPDCVASIGSEAFANCCKLSSVVFPDSIKYIGRSAFSGCVDLEYIELPSVDVDIDKTAFADCPKLKTKFRKHVDLKTNKALATKGLFLNPMANDEECAWVVTYQSKDAWLEWAIHAAENIDNVLQYCKQLVQNEKKPSTIMVKMITGFMLGCIADCKKKLSPESILDMLDLLEEKKCKVDRSPFGILKSKPTGEAGDQEAPYTAIAYQDKKITTSLDEIRFILSEYTSLWHQYKSIAKNAWGDLEILPIEYAIKIPISSKADQIADKFDRTALDKFLRTLATGTLNRPFLLSYARFATAGETAYIISQIRSKRRGNADEKRWASNMEAALLINDTQEAMQFFEDNRKLDFYAQQRDMTAQELRDSRMMPDFGFDQNGVKRYDIGGNIIEVTIAPNLTCQLFDTAKQKIIKTMPRKSDDPEKAAACAEAFTEFKKEIQQFYKKRMAIVHELHTEGTRVPGETWKKLYLGHPVLKYLTRLLVWQDETGKSFMPVEESIVDANGAPYDPWGKITLAHVLTLSAEETAAWQSYLSSRHLAQPFAQIWEPIVQWNDNELKNRYKGATVSKAARNAVKKALGAWGITMRSEAQEGSFNTLDNKYEFSNEGTLNFENCYYLDYTVNPDTGDTTFASGRMARDSIGKERTARIMNAVLLHLDLAVASSFAARDQADKLSQVKLDELTVVQINDLIDVAIKNQATNCTALLLNLKNKRFSAFEQFDDLVLDW